MRIVYTGWVLSGVYLLAWPTILNCIFLSKTVTVCSVITKYLFPMHKIESCSDVDITCSVVTISEDLPPKQPTMHTILFISVLPNSYITGLEAIN